MASDYRSPSVLNRTIVAICCLVTSACISPGPWQRVDAARDTVLRRHVAVPSDEKLADAALRGFVEALDPHSVYLSEEELRWFEEDVRGAYGGVGFEVVTDADEWRVVSVISDGPASAAGVRVGDIIDRVDDMKPSKTPRIALMRALRGSVPGAVRVHVKRDGVLLPEMLLQRARLAHSSVFIDSSTLASDGIAVVRLRQFQEGTVAEFDVAVQSILAVPSQLRGIVLDLRGNPGGIVDVARHVADAWIDRGPIHSMGLRGEARHVVNAAPGAPLLRFATAILVDAATASAAELLAAALRDRAGARLIGERTFGKGTVQILEKLQGGGALDVTVGDYRTACGASIQAQGLTPDLVLAGAGSSRPIQREEDLPRALILDGPAEPDRRPQFDALTSIVRPTGGAGGTGGDAAIDRARSEVLEMLKRSAVFGPRECPL